VSVRIGLDLEPGLAIARTLPGLDLLDIAYGAVHGGAQIILVPVSAFVTSTAYQPELFNRPGLPVFSVKAEERDVDRIPGLGLAPDRLLITGEGSRSVTDAAGTAEAVLRTIGSNQELGILAEPEAAVLKELARARVPWVFFSTEPVYAALSGEEAAMELARLRSAALAAGKLNLRVALYGPTGRHLPPALAALTGVEEIYPAPDLWALALRAGWEGALAEYRDLLR
jgi:hypothetical protein